MSTPITCPHASYFTFIVLLLAGCTTASDRGTPISTSNPPLTAQQMDLWMPDKLLDRPKNPAQPTEQGMATETYADSTVSLATYGTEPNVILLTVMDSPASPPVLPDARPATDPGIEHQSFDVRGTKGFCTFSHIEHRGSAMIVLQNRLYVSVSGEASISELIAAIKGLPLEKLQEMTHH